LLTKTTQFKINQQTQLRTPLSYVSFILHIYYSIDNMDSSYTEHHHNHNEAEDHHDNDDASFQFMIDRRRLSSGVEHNVNGTSSSEHRTFVDNLVGATKKCNSLVLTYCSMCTGYMDKQVQYEVMQQSYQAMASDAAKATATAASMFQFPPSSNAGSSNSSSVMTFDFANCNYYDNDVQDMATEMFDEDSVVDSISTR